MRYANSSWLAIAITSLAVTGCIKMVPPVVAPVRPVNNVAATFDDAWGAVVEVFATNNIPIETLEKASGLVVAAPSGVSQSDGDTRASCGGIKHGLDPARKLHATHGEYNVLVRAVGAGSTVRVNVRWTSRNPTDPMKPDYSVCETTNIWETKLEGMIRTLAESNASRRE